MTNPIAFPVPSYADAEAAIIAGLRSHHSRAAYHTVYRYFRGNLLSARAVQGYLEGLRQAGKSPATENLHLSALKALAAKAAEYCLISREDAAAIAAIKGAPQRGTRLGNWLSPEQARALLSAPPANTRFGVRDRALLELLVGAGLRRGEVASLTWGHLQQREGRAVLVDICGKGQRVRSVPVSARTEAAIARWRDLNADAPESDLMMCGLTPTGIYKRVMKWAAACGITVAPHDLRRTFAQLARRGQAPIEQIQLTLGHSSVATTERYLGSKLDLKNAACDVLEGLL